MTHHQHDDTDAESGSGRTLADLSHTHPYTDAPFGAAVTYRRGVVTDGGIDDPGRDGVTDGESDDSQSDAVPPAADRDGSADAAAGGDRVAEGDHNSGSDPEPGSDPDAGSDGDGSVESTDDSVPPDGTLRDIDHRPPGGADTQGAYDRGTEGRGGSE